MKGRCHLCSARALACLTAATMLLHTAVAQSAFEVASVKPADLIRNPVVEFRAYRGGRVVVANYTLKMLTAEAYGVSEYRVTGGPPWVDEDFYNITAKPPAGSAAAAFMPPRDYAYPSPALLGMMRTLLADRFGLKLHRDARRLPVLALVVGKGGPKLEPARDPSGDPDWSMHKERKEWRSITMLKLVAILEAHYRRTVLDRTGLTGTYDFDLSYDPSARDIDDNGDLSSDPTRISLKTALETQIGLRIEETKGAVETLVIDEAKRPSAN